MRAPAESIHGMLKLDLGTENSLMDKIACYRLLHSVDSDYEVYYLRIVILLVYHHLALLVLLLLHHHRHHH